MLTTVLVTAILIFGAGQQPARGERQQRERAAESQSAAQPAEHSAMAEKAAEKAEVKEEKPVVTHHEVNVRGRVLKYTATAGLMPLKDENGTVEAHIFYIAYTLDDVDRGKRPLTFAFNGGPGSASIWVHLGCMGPKRIRMQDDGGMPAPPYHLEDNPYTWLDQTDLVFIDPVGTGYSRPVKPELGKKFWGLQGDISSVGNFIRLYLTEYDRWVSPLFLAGESYGTTRSAGLAGYLIDHGVAFNGIILISTVLNFETLLPARGNDLPYILYLPSFTSTAWFHKKLPPDMQQKSLTDVVAESEKWAGTEYLVALQKGDSMSAQERQDVISKLASFTGLEKGLIDDANLR
ncbi:MAG TPA: peptidase S10, partial [Blastocatellia bacterium]|nr:peptidase S10 [Blastocatellia bacterium]